ncbi:16472_t:CDS:2 [Gigaspora rosea]|nr:16472_t:CDS:2 [Gigaspora rosea]
MFFEFQSLKDVSLLYYDLISPLYDPYFDSFPHTKYLRLDYPDTLWNPARDQRETSPRSRSSIPISDQSQTYGSRVKDIFNGIQLCTRGVPKEGILIDLSLTVQGESKRKPTYEAATSRVSERKVEKFRKIPRGSADQDHSKITIQ